MSNGVRIRAGRVLHDDRKTARDTTVVPPKAQSREKQDLLVPLF